MRRSRARYQPQCYASSPPPYAPPVLGRSLSVSQQSGQARQLAYSAPLLGKASPCYHLAAIPPHLCRGKPRQKCSGRPGHSRSGCWRCVYAPVSGNRRSSRKYTQRRWSSARLRLKRRSFVPASDPSRLRPWRPSVSPQRRSLSGSGSLRSSSPCTAKARRPHTLPDRLQGHAPLRSAPYGTARLLDACKSQYQNSTFCAAASKRLDSTIGHQASHAPSSELIRASYSARTDEKGVYIYQGSSGGSRCGCS